VPDARRAGQGTRRADPQTRPEAEKSVAPREQRSGEWRAVYGAFILLVAGFFLYSTRSVLSPFIIYLLFLYLIAPFAGTRRHLTLMVASTALLFIWMVATLGGLLAPFVLAMALAYILSPLVDALERRGVPRAGGIAILALPILGLAAVAIIFGIPALIGQIQALIEQVPAALERASQWAEGLRLRVSRMNLPFVDETRLMTQLELLDEARISAFLQERQTEIVQRGWSAVLGVGRGVTFALTLLGYVVLTPVLTTYLLRDFPAFKGRAAALMPEKKRASWTAFLLEYDRLLSRFLRGQLLAASIVGVLTWLGLLIAGFPYSGLVGAVAAVFNVVPYLGLIVSVIPVLIIALLSGSFLAAIVKAGIVFAIVQAIDGSVTGPRIVGESVGLNPVLVILALAVGSFFFGFVGLLLAMPVAVLLKLLLRESVQRYRNSRVFRGTMAADDPA
jgi:predicted PurR-regulated permease PerM